MYRASTGIVKKTFIVEFSKRIPRRRSHLSRNKWLKQLPSVRAFFSLSVSLCGSQASAKIIKNMLLSFISNLRFKQK